jgi:hypothetical protein
MRVPSAKRLIDTFRVDATTAKLIRAIAHATDKPESLRTWVEDWVPTTAEYVRGLYSSPYGSAIWRATVALHAINALLGAHGVEALGPVRDGDYAPKYEYLNMGDAYSPTLVYNRDSRSLSIACWGDIAERF